MSHLLRLATLRYELDQLANIELLADDKRRGREFLRRIMARYIDLLGPLSPDDPHLEFSGGIQTPARLRYLFCGSPSCITCRMVSESYRADRSTSYHAGTHNGHVSLEPGPLDWEATD